VLDIAAYPVYMNIIIFIFNALVYKGSRNKAMHIFPKRIKLTLKI